MSCVTNSSIGVKDSRKFCRSVATRSARRASASVSRWMNYRARTVATRSASAQMSIHQTTLPYYTQWTAFRTSERAMAYQSTISPAMPFLSLWSGLMRSAEKSMSILSDRMSLITYDWIRSSTAVRPCTKRLLSLRFKILARKTTLRLSSRTLSCFNRRSSRSWRKDRSWRLNHRWWLGAIPHTLAPSSHAT